MTILVTGASGLIGSHLCKRLVKDGESVVGLVHRAESPVLASIPRGNFQTEACDILDYNRLHSVVTHYQPDTVFHLAACCLPHHSDDDFANTNAFGTANLLAALQKTKVKKLIYASTMSVYSTPPAYLPVDERHPTQPEGMYGKSKLVGELMCACLAKSIDVIILRFSSVFGVGDTSRVVGLFMRVVLSGEPLLVQGAGSQSSDFIYVDNAIRGAILAMEKGKSGEVYNIGSGQETSVLELANLIAGLGETKVEVKLSGRPATRPFRFVADIEKARRELGYIPSDLVDGLRKYREEATKCTY